MTHECRGAVGSGLVQDATAQLPGPCRCTCNEVCGSRACIHRARKVKGENLGTCHSWLQTQSATGRRPDEVHDHAHRGHRCEQWQRACLYRRGRRRPRPRARAGAKFAAIGTAAPGLALIIRPVNHGGGDLQYTWRLEPRGSRPATCCHSLVRLARGAVQFKYQNLQLPHALSCLAISCCTACFAIFWWNDTKLSGTIFPRIFWLRLGLYGGSALFELGIFLLFRFAPQHACKHAVPLLKLPDIAMHVANADHSLGRR